MSTIKKTVRFYEPVSIDSKGKSTSFKAGFWSALDAKCAKLSATERTSSSAGVQFYGSWTKAKKPAALSYLLLGRLRPRGDWPDAYDSTNATVAPLVLGNGTSVVLHEPTWFVPILTSSKNHVAVMTPTIGATRASLLETWFTHVLGLAATGKTFELRPVVDPNVLTKLQNQAVGLRSIDFSIAPGATLAPTGGGEIADAARAALLNSGTLGVSMLFSAGHGLPAAADRSMLLTFGRWLVQQKGVRKAKASMLFDTANGGLRTEQHDLFKDNLSQPAEFSVPDDAQPAEVDVLAAILEAIAKFQAQV